MSTLEKRIETRLRETAKRLGGVSLKLLPFYWRGVPDRLVLLHGGGIWFVELKSENKKAEPIQKVRHRFLTRLGFKVRVANTIEKYLELENELKEWYKLNPIPQDLTN